MIKFTNKVHIQRPLDEVFEFVSDFENLSKWKYYVLNVNKISESESTVGAVYHQVRKTDQQDFKIQEYQPNKSVAIETLPPEDRLMMRFQFIEKDGGTEVIDVWEYEIDTPALLRGIARRKIKSAVAENLSKLKTLLENGQVTLQDGRQISLS
jgi:uncharacterized membrane protein